MSTRVGELAVTLGAFAEAVTDYARLLDTIVSGAARVCGGFCAISLISDDGEWLEAVAAFDSDPQALEAIRQLMVFARVRVSADSPPSEVVRTGRPYFAPALSQEAIRARFPEESWALVEGLQIRSVVQVPMRSQGLVLGVVTLNRHGEGALPFDATDLEFAQHVADHAGLAIANSRLLTLARRELAERTRAEAALAAAEAQLRHAQKMEAIGRLAGGIAHDFNNLLTVILSYTAVLSSELDAGDPRLDHVEEIGRAGSRAADLTRQLLAFSRQQVARPQRVDLNALLSGLAPMLQRLIGADISLEIMAGADLGAVRADPGHLEQVVMNLVVNARDAMPTGGVITLETCNVGPTEDSEPPPSSPFAGPSVMFSVRDTGTGIDPATQARIFEPFFTTKEVGKGTGLGLSTTFGIVQQSGGDIVVDSQPGRGTTFAVFLPRTFEEPRPPSTRPPPAQAWGSESVLLVEDDPQVRVVASAMLAARGYRVIEAADGQQALSLSHALDEDIDLLLTDLVMPRMGGIELAKRMHAHRPNLRVLYASGQADVAEMERVLGGRLALLQKPFTAETLLGAVRVALGG
jgi:signal transduction histidine kinase